MSIIRSDKRMNNSELFIIYVNWSMIIKDIPVRNKNIESACLEFIILLITVPIVAIYY